MRYASLLLFLVVSSRVVNDSHGFTFTFSSRRKPTAATSRMITAVRVANSGSENENTESSELSSRPSRRDIIFRGSLLAGAGAAAALTIPFENAKAMGFSSEKSRIGGLADKIRGILKNMASCWRCCGFTFTHPLDATVG
jgi:hypothetical protein